MAAASPGSRSSISGEVREWTGAENEVWSYGEENYEIMVKFIRIREMMRDYTRSVMQAAHDVGAPVMRAMFYEFPEDKVCWEIQDAYMFGAGSSGGTHLS